MPVGCMYRSALHIANKERFASSGFVPLSLISTSFHLRCRHSSRAPLVSLLKQSFTDWMCLRSPSLLFVCLWLLAFERNLLFCCLLIRTLPSPSSNR